MKSITFDQLKIMLKSMSNTIFKRMGKLENKLDPPDKPIKHVYATDENGNAGWNSAAEMLGNVKPIIITRMYDRDEPYYMCNFTVDEIWDLDADVIQQNTRVIDGDNQYAVRGVNKIDERLYGKVIQFTVDLNAAYYDLENPPFMSVILTLVYALSKKMLSEQTQVLQRDIDASKPFQRNDCIHIPTNNGTGWVTSRLLGVKDKIGDYSVPVILNVVSSDYLALSSNYTRQEIPTYNIDIDRISVVQAAKNGALSDVVLCYTDSHEASVGKVTTLDRLEISGATNTYADVTFIMKPDENGKYARITLDEKNAGKAIVEWAQSDTLANKKVGKGLKMDGDALTVDEGEWELIEEIIVGYELLTAKPEDWETSWTEYHVRTVNKYEESTFSQITAETPPEWENGKYYKSVEVIKIINRTAEPNGKEYNIKAVWIEFEIPTATDNGYVTIEFCTADAKGGVYIGAGIKSASKSFYHTFALPLYGYINGWVTRPITGKTQQAAFEGPLNHSGLYLKANPFVGIRIQTNSKFPAGSIIKIRAVRA